MNIFEQYGIKEVADVCLYSIELDENDDEVYVPVLYLDTLKVSTIEETAEQTSARGGLGNPELIIWDYGKDITVNLEDALYSPASQSMTWGGKYGTKPFTLKGQLNLLSEGGQNLEESVPVNIIIKDFSNFRFDKALSTYFWVARLNIISDNNKYKFMIEKVNISYSLINKKWNSSPLMFLSGNNILEGDVNQDKTINWDDYYDLRSYTQKPETNSKIKKAGIFAADITDPKLSIDDKAKLSKYEEDEPIKEQLSGINGNDLAGLYNYLSGVAKYPDIANVCAVTINSENPYPPQEAIYQIDHSLQNVHFLDRMEKCIATQTFCIDTKTNTLHGNYRYLQQYSQCELTVFIDPRTMQPYEPNVDNFKRKNGETITGDLRVIKQHEIYYKWTRSRAIDNTSLGHQIIVDAIHFPGTYRLVGETYSRSRKTGKDQRYQFEIPLCKMGSENNLTLQADGDPTTFNMTLKVLRREDGVMMKLTQFDVAPAKYDGYTSDSTVVVPGDEVVPTTPNTGVV